MWFSAKLRAMKLHAVRRFSVILIALALTAGALAPKPEDVGLSSERLQRITQLVQRYIDAGKLRLGDPVSRFIPEFKGAKVAMAKAASATSRFAI